ncbi:MAG TPA: phage portal protein [Xanthobacteraceae bacterium]|nr:phage portal protein [Xanthobacteraceae bacterium]
MNILDRVVGYFSPVAGLRRASARSGLDAIRAYDGAMRGRRTENWRANNASANVTTKRALPTLRARSRDCIRNTWWGASTKRVVVSHAVGAGIMPKPDTGDKSIDKEVKAAWRRWAKSCDREGQLDFDGLIALATGCIVESGEVLARMVPVGQSSPDVVPLELQLLEPDHLDESRDQMMRSDRIVDQGIEYDAAGKRTGYWLLPTHPGARGIAVPRSSVRVPAADMVHAYRKDRIGQGRGVPWVAPVLLKGRDVADLEDAIVTKSRTEACLSVFVRSNDAARTLAGQSKTDRGGPNGTSRRIETLSPGMINYLEQGEEIQSVVPSSSGQFESVLMTNWLALAAGAGITYDQMTGDLRRANFSSLRAGKIEFRRMIEQFQWHTIVAMFLQPIWDRWVEVAVDAGVLPRRKGGYPVEWIMPANEPIDPMKDMQADIMAVRSGRMTWPQFVAAWGYDPDVQLDEIELWTKEFDRRDVALDIDARRPAKGGSIQVHDKEEDNVQPTHD